MEDEVEEVKRDVRDANADVQRAREMGTMDAEWNLNGEGGNNLPLPSPLGEKKRSSTCMFQVLIYFWNRRRIL
jgi:hypothetical protein